ncbi:MAG: type II/IV secretion system protein, partial [Candidatus Pacebacteria bacterium]|nr:type II/IV secretion system protein [Candidatus Paceibacterota bacterium]
IEAEENKSRVRYRIDGILQEKLTLPKKVHDSLIARIKIMANLKIDERRLPQDGRIKIKVGDEEIDLRVSTLPTAFGEKVVIRLLRDTGSTLKLKDLGLRGVSLKRLEEALLKPYGIILVTGPTGSGKTVTLATCLRRLNTSRVNIITLEDPVEIRIEGVNQVQINNAAGLTFASGLRSILRQDPNIIMVGEIRDSETASLAINAALTGHSVLSTLHTNSAAGAVPRMLDMKVEPFLLASTLNLSMAQRLVRKVCASCKEEYKAPEAMAKQIREILEGNKNIDLPKEVNGEGEITLYRGKGCDVCGTSGYKGRMGIYEVMEISEAVVELMLNNKSSGEIERKGVEEGMITLMQDGVMKALEGLTTMEEVLRVARE